MPEHLRALCFILFVAIIVFTFGKRVACPEFIAENEFCMRRNLWCGLTISAFIAHNYWLFYIISGFLIIQCTKSEKNQFSLYLFLMIALPNLPKTLVISGLKIFEFDYLRLLSMTILFPTFLKLKKISPNANNFGFYLQDKILAGYLILSFILHFRVNTPAEQLRFAIYLILGGFLPYFVASRTLNSEKDMRNALMSFTIPCMVMGIIGLLEWKRHWLLYSSLKQALGVEWGYMNYVARGPFLRAVGTPAQPILLGYVMAVALGAFLFFKKEINNKMVWNIGLIMLAAGLLSSLSRGPWIGASSIIVIYLITSPFATSNLFKLCAFILILITIGMVTNTFDMVIDYLPFVGRVDSGNVEFRKRILTESIDIIMRNPLFGNLEADLEQFKTGENIIDIVNTYVIIAIQSGLIGLCLFLTFFITICSKIYFLLRKLEDNESALYSLGRTLLAILVGILLIIFTVSDILVIPYLYWSMAGISMAYINFVSNLIVQRKGNS